MTFWVRKKRLETQWKPKTIEKKSIRIQWNPVTVASKSIKTRSEPIKPAKNQINTRGSQGNPSFYLRTDSWRGVSAVFTTSVPIWFFFSRPFSRRREPVKNETKNEFDDSFFSTKKQRWKWMENPRFTSVYLIFLVFFVFFFTLVHDDLEASMSFSVLTVSVCEHSKETNRTRRFW